MAFETEAILAAPTCFSVTGRIVVLPDRSPYDLYRAARYPYFLSHNELERSIAATCEEEVLIVDEVIDTALERLLRNSVCKRECTVAIVNDALVTTMDVMNTVTVE